MKNYIEVLNKIKTCEEIKKIVETLRQENPSVKIVTTNGAFDIMHIGHVRSLSNAKSFGDILIVGLNSDSSVKAYKSPLRPIIPQRERAEMLASIGFIDYIVIFDEPDPRELLNVIKPNFHVKYRTGYKGIEKDVVERNGGKIIITDDSYGFSTTDIFNKIKEIIEKEPGN
ncbi:MAG TPA: adenylyltransferase/cytidyltransferase family protein [Patescibacteria group bacterium]|nr:adenylyltransferase/cytidyltransferase family protein [Patescibacteria group bacterium]